MKISLMVLSAGKAGKALPITTAQFLIGRDPECNLRPASAMISKRHCAVLYKNGQVSLRDFDSTNGTFVNEEQIKGEVPLKDGDTIKVGPLSFKVVIEGKPEVKQPGKPTPPPPVADISDDDAAAAALLAFEDDGNVTVSTSDTGDAVPGGSTIMDMPAFAKEEGGEQAAKPEEKKTGGKKHAAGAAQDAAKAILDKLRTGKRKTT